MPNVKRGGHPSPRHRLAAATPHRIVGATPAQFLWFPKQLSEWGNFNFGDCVTAEECFAKACHDPEIFIPQHKAIKWARNHSILNGAGVWEVLDLMQREGIDHDGHVYLDGDFFSVDWTDQAILQNAVAQGPVKLGVASDQLINDVWQTTPFNGWLATGITPGDPQDHCISLCGYGTFAWLAAQLGASSPASLNPNEIGWAIFTWDSVGMIDWPSLQNITGEAWLRSPVTIIK